MTEIEKTLGEVYTAAFQVAVAGHDFAKANEIAAEQVAAEAVRRWLRDLPPGDEGLQKAFPDAWRASDKASETYCDLDALAAVLAVLKQRGWIDTASLPPGDENLVGVFRSAGGALGDCSDHDRDFYRRGIAAVLEVNAQRLRDAVKGEALWQMVYRIASAPESLDGQGDYGRGRACADAVLSRLHADGWKSPEEVNDLRGQLLKAGQENQNMRERAISESDWLPPEEVAKLRAELAEKNEEIGKRGDRITALEESRRFARAEVDDARQKLAVFNLDRLVQAEAEVERLKKIEQLTRKMDFDRDFWKTKQRSFDEQTRNLNSRILELSEQAEERLDRVTELSASLDTRTEQRDKAWRAARKMERAVVECREYTAQAANEMLDGEDIDEWKRVVQEAAP
jgi:hypothetical protein